LCAVVANINFLVKKTIRAKHMRVPVSTLHEHQDAENFSQNILSIPSLLLMENAGAFVARCALKIIKKSFDPHKLSIAIFCGPGNNGADGLVCARLLLAHDLNIVIYFTAEKSEFCDNLITQLKILENIHTNTNLNLKFIKNINEVKSENLLIIDAIFGAGLNRAPQDASLAAINYINFLKSTDKRCCVLSIDLPSGLNFEANVPAGACVKADYTATFGHLKRCHISEPTNYFTGITRVGAIGLFFPIKPTNFYFTIKKPLNDLLKPVRKTFHKGNFGHVAILEGHPNYIGASRLAARAALRVGAGLVTLITHENAKACSTDSPEFLKQPMKELTERYFERISCLIIGPGLSNEQDYIDKARQVLKLADKYIKYVILEAEALGLISSQNNTHINYICTPHPKEAAYFLNISVDQVEANRFLALDNLLQKAPQALWLLKGATTLVKQRKSAILAFKGNQLVLATGGSGDILAGAIGGLVAQTNSTVDAVTLALSLQICAARQFKKGTKGIFASEIADRFPELLKQNLSQN
jgi:NAD(P)H-hydrate epimerase